MICVVHFNHEKSVVSLRNIPWNFKCIFCIRQYWNGKGGITLWNDENNTWGRKGWELLE